MPEKKYMAEEHATEAEVWTMNEDGEVDGEATRCPLPHIIQMIWMKVFPGMVVFPPFHSQQISTHACIILILLFGFHKRWGVNTLGNYLNTSLTEGPDTSSVSSKGCYDMSTFFFLLLINSLAYVVGSPSGFTLRRQQTISPMTVDHNGGNGVSSTATTPRYV